MNGFRVNWLFPGESTILAAEVVFEAQPLCLVRCDREDDVLQVDFFHDLRDRMRTLQFPLAEFVLLMEAVGQEVRELRRDAGLLVPPCPVWVSDRSTRRLA